MSKVLVIGADKGNVGSSCYHALESYGFDIDAPHFPEFDASSPTMVTELNLSGYQHLVLCNAFVEVKELRHQSYVSISEIVNCTLMASVYMTKRFLECTQYRSDVRRVVTIGSHSAEWPNRWLGPYCAAKAGLNQFVKCMQREYGHEGYRFFCINPGPIGTSFQERLVEGTAQITKQKPSEVKGTVLSRSGLGRMLTPREVGQFAAQLVHGNYDWMCGNPIPFTGGQR